MSENPLVRADGREHLFAQEGFDDEQSARRHSRDLAVDLLDALKEAGYSDFCPPERPKDPDVIWDEFANCRILIQWIPDWSPNPLRGKFAARADTLAFRRKIGSPHDPLPITRPLFT